MKNVLRSLNKKFRPLYLEGSPVKLTAGVCFVFVFLISGLYYDKRIPRFFRSCFSSNVCSQTEFKNVSFHLLHFTILIIIIIIKIINFSSTIYLNYFE